MLDRQKVVPLKHPGRKPGGPRKLQSTTTASRQTLEKVKLKLKLKSDAYDDALLPGSAYQFPLSAPPSDDTPERENTKDNMLHNFKGQVGERGGRQMIKVHALDMVFGSKMDKLVSTATKRKTVKEGVVHMASSPPTIFGICAPECYVSPDTVQGADQARPHYNTLNSQDVHSILNKLCSLSEIQVDLPNMWAAGSTTAVKPYTGSFLTSLYIQCYQNHLWHLCDLIADTWIRALQKANKHSHKNKDVQEHMWRSNSALERMFREKKKGFKRDVEDYGLNVQDPGLDDDVTDFNAERLQMLYDHTRTRCGARLLWADAMALGGRKMEGQIEKRPWIWPKELVYDIMCTALRMVGRKLTLKIEEKYEGAWCRYHEHVKHGLPCYRELVWRQKRQRGNKECGNREKDETDISVTTGKKRGQGALDNDSDEQDDAKRVRFNAEKTNGFGDLATESESEEG